MRKGVWSSEVHDHAFLLLNTFECTPYVSEYSARAFSVSGIKSRLAWVEMNLSWVLSLTFFVCVLWFINGRITSYSRQNYVQIETTQKSAFYSEWFPCHLGEKLTRRTSPRKHVRKLEEKSKSSRSDSGKLGFGNKLSPQKQKSDSDDKLEENFFKIRIKWVIFVRKSLSIFHSWWSDSSV